MGSSPSTIDGVPAVLVEKLIATNEELRHAVTSLNKLLATADVPGGSIYQSAGSAISRTFLSDRPNLSTLKDVPVRCGDIIGSEYFDEIVQKQGYLLHLQRNRHDLKKYISLARREVESPSNFQWKC